MRSSFSDVKCQCATSLGFFYLFSSLRSKRLLSHITSNTQILIWCIHFFFLVLFKVSFLSVILHCCNFDVANNHTNDIFQETNSLTIYLVASSPFSTEEKRHSLTLKVDRKFNTVREHQIWRQQSHLPADANKNLGHERNLWNYFSNSLTSCILLASYFKVFAPNNIILTKLLKLL